MSQALFILFALFCIVVGTLYFLKKTRHGSGGHMFHARTQAPGKKEIPAWLETCLQDYARQALAYSLHQLSLYTELSPEALAEQQKLGLKVYVRPALMLREAKKKEKCSDNELNRFLDLYYTQTTGEHMKIQIDSVYTVQEMMLRVAQEKAQTLQKNRIAGTGF